MESSEQSSGFLLLLVFACFLGTQIEVTPLDNTQTVCQRWYDYQGRDAENRPFYHYKKGCWND